MIAGVLLVPADGDPLGLLSEGPCGSRPPMVQDHQHKDGRPCWDPTCGRARHLMRENRRALVLAWDGQIIPEGIDRADRVRNAHRGTRRDGGIGHAVARLLVKPSLESRQYLRRAAVSLGQIVIVDAAGIEVMP